MKFSYKFPATKFVSNSPWRQWRHMFSEVVEVGFALLRKDWQHASRETIDVGVSGETMNRILSGLGADIDMAYKDVVVGHIRRGYYK